MRGIQDQILNQSDKPEKWLCGSTSCWLLSGSISARSIDCCGGQILEIQCQHVFIWTIRQNKRNNFVARLVVGSFQEALAPDPSTIVEDRYMSKRFQWDNYSRQSKRNNIVAPQVVGFFQDASVPAPASVEDKCWGYSVKMCSTDQKQMKEEKEKTPKDRCAGYSVEMCLIDQQMSWLSSTLSWLYCCSLHSAKETKKKQKHKSWSSPRMVRKNPRLTKVRQEPKSDSENSDKAIMSELLLTLSDMKQFCLIQKCVHCDSWPLVSLIPAGTSRTSSMSHQKTDGFHSEGWFTMLGIQHSAFPFWFFVCNRIATVLWIQDFWGLPLSGQSRTNCGKGILSSCHNPTGGHITTWHHWCWRFLKPFGVQQVTKLVHKPPALGGDPIGCESCLPASVSELRRQWPALRGFSEPWIVSQSSLAWFSFWTLTLTLRQQLSEEVRSKEMHLRTLICLWHKPWWCQGVSLTSSCRRASR